MLNQKLNPPPWEENDLTKSLEVYRTKFLAADVCTSSHNKALDDVLILAAAKVKEVDAFMNRARRVTGEEFHTVGGISLDELVKIVEELRR